MPNFVFAYHGLTRPKDGAQHMTRWKAWMNSLGAAMINPGVPLGMSKTVTSEGVIDGGGANPLAGFSVVEAASMDAAIEMARRCPHLDIGTIEVAEAMNMSMKP